MAQTHTLVVALGATYAGLTLRLQMADVLTGAAVSFASVGSDSGSAAWRTDADSDTWVVQGVAGTYTVRCTAWPDAAALPVRVDIYNATGPVLLASGLLAQEDVDAVLGTDVPTAAAIADAIADEQTSGHTTPGSSAKAWADAAALGNPWDVDPVADPPPDGSYGDILLGLDGGTVYAIGSSPNITAALLLRRGNTQAVEIGDLDIDPAWEAITVTLKRTEHEPDSKAVLQVRLEDGADPGPGLLRVQGEAPVDAGVVATDAWLSDVVTGVGGSLVLNIAGAAAALLQLRSGLWWDVKQYIGTDPTSLATGEKTAVVLPDITRAVS